MSHYKTIKALGTPHVVYQGLIDFLDDFELAVMLSHLLYWSDKTDNPLGVYRSNAEWYELYRFKDAKVKILSDKLQARGLIKKTYKRLDHRMYYLLDVAEFDRQYEIFANQQNNTSPIAKIEIGEQQKQGLADGQNQDSLYTKITTKNTNKDYCKESMYTHDENEKENFQTSSQAKTPKTTNSSAKKYLTADDLVNLGVDEQVANDYLATRKTKLTQTALNGIIKQADLANLTLCQAIEIAAENGWQSFKAEWYNKPQTLSNPKGNQHATYQRTPAINPAEEYYNSVMAEYERYYGSASQPTFGQGFAGNVYDVETAVQEQDAAGCLGFADSSTVGGSID